MALRDILTGVVTGAVVSIGIADYFFGQKLEEELQHNLSQNVVKAQIVQSQPPNTAVIPLPEGIAKDEAFLMVYVDNVGGESYKVFVSTQEYFRFKQMRHRNRDIADLVNFVTYNNETIRITAEYMTKELTSPQEKAKRLLDFVHSHLYDIRIEENEDYVRYPLETMVERNGDCEDLAILGAGLMKSIGLDVALVRFLPQEGETAGHVGLGVAGDFSGSYFNINGKKYFYAEATGTNWLTTRATWSIGDIPPEYVSRNAEVYVVN